VHALLQSLSDRVRLCYERAAEAKQRAEETTDLTSKTDFLKIEQRWLLLARSYQFGESVDDFTRWASSRRLSLAPDAGNGAEDFSTIDPADDKPIRGHETDVAAILANTPFLLTRCSSDLRYLFVSDACARMLGLRPKDIEGKRIVDIIGEEGFRTILPHVGKVLQGEEVEYETDIHYAGVGPRRVRVKYTPDRDGSGNVRGWIASIIDVTDHRKAEAQIAADLQAMTILREMGSLYVRKDLPMGECLQRTIEAAITIVGADKGNIQVFDATANSLVIAAHRGFAEPFLTFFKHVRDHASSCAAAMQANNQVIIEDVLNSEIFVGQQSQAVLIDAGVRAVVSTPLMSSNGNLVGMISTYYTSPHRPTHREAHLIEVLGRQTADYLERKRAEETEKTLAREQNHRCNNLLAVVQAIANQSLSEGCSIEEAKVDFVARLQSLARINQQILRSDWSGVELHQLIEAELDPFGMSEVTVEGIPVTVRPHDAQNLSMALHELVTNASKYGALSSAGGRVDISWTITRENNPTLHFRWRETGGPRVVQPDRQGCGTTLLKGMFTGIRFEYLEEGLDCAFDLEL
jgi:PAS domain S-box-containing protein